VPCRRHQSQLPSRHIFKDMVGPRSTIIHWLQAKRCDSNLADHTRTLTDVVGFLALRLHARFATFRRYHYIHVVLSHIVKWFLLDLGTGPQWPPTLFLFLLLVLLLSDLRSAKAFSFHSRSSSNFAYTHVTTLSTIAPWRIFKLSPN